MEQIIRSILKQQSIDQIGVFDQEKDIWMYVKDEEVHFCKSDLAPIERNAIGIDQNLVIFTYSNGSFHIIRDDDTFTNFIVIDSTNKILLFKEEKKYTSDLYVLQKADNSNFIIIGKKEWEKCIEKTPSNYYVRYMWMDIVRNSFVFIEKEYKKNYNLCYYINSTFFVKNSSERYSQFVIAIERGKGVVYQGWLSSLWTHENGKVEIISFDEHSYSIVDRSDNEEKTEEYRTSIVNMKQLGSGREYSFKVSDYITHADILYNNTELNNYDDKRLFSDKYLVVPFNYGYGAFVVQHVDDDISAYTIKFNTTYRNSPYRSFNIQFLKDILRIRETYGSGSGVESFYYDINGCYMGSTYGEGNHYLIYANSDNSFFKSSELKGIMKVNESFWISDNNIKVITHPIFDKIEVIDEINGVFKVWLRDYVAGEYDNKINILLYSEKSGVIIYDGYINKPHYLNYYGEYDEPCEDYVGDPIAACKQTNDFLVFTNKEKKGLLFKGEKVLDAQFEEIEGFNFVDDFGEHSDYIVKERTEEYNPHGVFLCEENDLAYGSCHYGLFYDSGEMTEKGYDIINPIYDSIRCEKIFKGHAYFIVTKNGKKGIISDDYLFNQTAKVEYDFVKFKAITADECYFVVKINGKGFGAICTKEELNVPLIFDSIDKIVKAGIISDGVLYDRNGNELFAFGYKYKHIDTNCCDVFESWDYDDFVFIDLNGRILKYRIDEDDDNIVHVEGIKESFDKRERNFVEDDDDHSYFDSGYTQDELDDMYRAAFEGDPEAEWNID